MLKGLLRAAVGGVAAALLAMIASHYFMKPERASVRRAGDEPASEDLSEAQQEQLLRELGSLT